MDTRSRTLIITVDNMGQEECVGCMYLDNAEYCDLFCCATPGDMASLRCEECLNAEVEEIACTGHGENKCACSQ